MAKSLRWGLLLSGTVLGAGLWSACGSSNSDNQFCDGGPCGNTGKNGDGGGDDGGNPGFGDDGGIQIGDGSATADPTKLKITCDQTAITLPYGSTTPTVTCTTQYDGANVSPLYSIDRGELGAIDKSSGVFTPSGKVGGTATLSALYENTTVTTTLAIKLTQTENGDPNASDAGAGSGGYNGVGGDGTGGSVANTGVLDGTAPTADSSLTWLYPYDKTVFPKGILAPLLQWNVGAAGDYDSIKIHLSEAGYDYVGYFSKPTAASTFKNHPVLTDAWTALYQSNAGNEAVTVDITLAKGATTYALPTRTWTIANGYLQGTVYYQAYNTQLVKNSDFTVNIGGQQQQVGAATLAIRRDSTGPVLIAGMNGSTQGEGCRVCHVVSGDGSTILTQKTKFQATPDNSDYPNYWQTEKFPLTTSGAGTESSIGPDNGQFAWGALNSNATLLLSNSGGGIAGAVDMSENDTGVSKISQLWNVGSATAVTSTGLPADLQASTPSFSPDGKHVAFNYWAGTGTSSNGDQKSLGIADFDGTSAFTNLGSVYTPSSGQIVWPSFLPTNDGVVFSVQFTGNYSSTGWDSSYPHDKPTSELWWWDRNSNKAARLDNLNGVGFLPDGPNTHTGAGDAVLNFEPTVNPVPSGGYAWVVFTSRRIYGNVATLSPYASDPRYDDGVNSVSQPTPKKLWVAAVDLGATGGTDPSHPGFYLPAQELLGGNSRGYWSVDPCAADGQSCATGDQCCGGYCQADGASGALVCSSTKPTCAQVLDKCTTDSDCCNAGPDISCLNNRCTQKIR